ncbi:MAG: hypothetical protein E6Q58_04915 [Niabella sp.]|nr:MAG: hypothetical protein E6Q58_04915 [Niabella sp.]
MKKISIFFLLCLTFLFSKAQEYVDGGGSCGGNSPCHTTISAGVMAASSGEAVIVYPGTYDEMVVIEKAITLQSTGGKAVTTIKLSTIGGYIAPIMIQADPGSITDPVIIGGSGNTGFTIIGTDVTQDANGGGLESAAIIIGSNSNNTISSVTIQNNTISANGDLAILTYYKTPDLYSNLIIKNNTINGTTFVENPEAGSYWAHGNVPRIGVAINKGVNVLDFNNNLVYVTTGKKVEENKLGNHVLYSRATNSVIRGNYFEPGLTDNSSTAPSNGVISVVSGSYNIGCNYFSFANSPDATNYVVSSDSGFPNVNVATENSFVNPGGYYNSTIPYISIVSSSTPANSIYPAPNCTIIPLPVTFGSVLASIKNNQLVVNWSTLNESNNDYFEIEASADGNSFTPIGRVNSKALNGLNSSNISYSFSKDLSDIALMGLSFMVLSGLMIFGFKRNKWMYIISAIALIVVMGISCKKQIGNIDNQSIDKLFIRIAQVDKDGTKTFSKTISAILE